MKDIYMSDRKHLFCFGAGFSAGTLARLLVSDGWAVSGTTRTKAKMTALKEAGISPYLFDGARPGKLEEALETTSHVLISVPPGEDGDPALLHHAEQLAENFGSIEWIGYLSTIGVYGDHDGAWIDENTEPAPVSKRSKWRLEAEQTWQAFAGLGGAAINIFRLPGIYGPGRSQLEQVKRGTARRLVKEGQIFNRIHVDDIARVVKAAMIKSATDCLYNLSDDEPAAPQDVVAYAAELLGVEPPPLVKFEGAELSPMTRSFYGECKRVGNDRIKNELGVTLKYPTYREGLRAIFEAMG